MTTTSPVADALTVVGSRKRAGRWTGWAFVCPFMIVFLLVFVAPVLYAFYLSLFQNQMVGGVKFVGGANYLQALADPQFWDSVIRVVVFLAVQVPIMLFLALFAALALDSGRLRAASFFRISVFLPYAVPAVVATLMWGFIYGPRFGLFGSINDFFGMDLPEPLSTNWVLAAIGNINTWEFTGYNMLIFYSALKVIPAELYEAANLDGAGTFRVISSIKLPSIRGAIGIASIFSVIGSFQLFNEPNILKALAPNSISSYFTPNMYAFNLSFAGQQFNYAAAISIIMGVLTVVVAYIVQISGSRKDA
ncbi:ABC transporter permease [Arthrobacter sp. StoSoilA2]|uniref:carbohydrate ABC transporter permease n=1 Tax=unclassified Arthrobacter TaxID=235627 RepID=UPI001CC7332D|nr:MULTISPECIES: sugar ABC transporter permease [unclassified Arthrobacter]MDR6685631.1 multiple sugar transport system permease protein [Arthrobacter sp. 1088]BCW35000.1 ABC transporter permease [Arthrobacter sp. StoSoilA2]